MPYVYRYVNSCGTVIYVGKTKNLDSRHYQHRSDDWYSDNLDLQYIPVETSTEADILETFFIGKYSNEGMCVENISKKWYGFSKSKFIEVQEDEWINYGEECPIKLSEKSVFNNIKVGDWVHIFICPCEAEIKYREYSKRNMYFDNFDYGQIRYRKINKVTAQYIECYHNWRYRRDSGTEIFYGGDEFNGLIATACYTELDVVKLQKDYLVSTYGFEQYMEWLHKSRDFKSEYDMCLSEAIDSEDDPVEKETLRMFGLVDYWYDHEYPYPYLEEAAKYMEVICERW